VTENWGTRSRLLTLAGSLLATLPVWPRPERDGAGSNGVQLPGEMWIIVPIVLAFPVAWVLLGRTRRHGLLVGWVLAGLVAAWSLWTANFAEYGTPPDVDDGLRWYLLTAGVVVVASVLIEARRQVRRLDRRWALGAVCWVIGMGVTAMIPVLDRSPMPPAEAVLPLPPPMIVVSDHGDCGTDGLFCSRRIVVAATNGMTTNDLVRRLGEHLEVAKGWKVQWYSSSAAPYLACRPVGWLVNPYELCADLRVEQGQSTVEVRLGHSNRYDPVY
jgi:hypothetical protein